MPNDVREHISQTAGCQYIGEVVTAHLHSVRRSAHRTDRAPRLHRGRHEACGAIWTRTDSAARRPLRP